MTKTTKPTLAITITKVRLKKKSIHLEWTEGNDTCSRDFHENPLPSFIEAIKALVPHVISLCELPPKYAEKMTATGITVTPKGDNAFALITSQKQIKKGKRVLNIATPTLPMDADEENKAADHLEPEQADAIELVIAEAKRYLAGDRAQGQITLEPSIDEDGGKESKSKLALLPDMEEEEEDKHDHDPHAP